MALFVSYQIDLKNLQFTSFFQLTLEIYSEFLLLDFLKAYFFILIPAVKVRLRYLRQISSKSLDR